MAPPAKRRRRGPFAPLTNRAGRAPLGTHPRIRVSKDPLVPQVHACTGTRPGPVRGLACAGGVVVVAVGDGCVSVWGATPEGAYVERFALEFPSDCVVDGVTVAPDGTVFAVCTRTKFDGCTSAALVLFQANNGERMIRLLLSEHVAHPFVEPDCVSARVTRSFDFVPLKSMCSGRDAASVDRAPSFFARAQPRSERSATSGEGLDVRRTAPFALIVAAPDGSVVHYAFYRGYRRLLEMREWGSSGLLPRSEFRGVHLVPIVYRAGVESHIGASALVVLAGGGAALYNIESGECLLVHRPSGRCRVLAASRMYYKGRGFCCEALVDMKPLGPRGNVAVPALSSSSAETEEPPSTRLTGPTFASATASQGLGVVSLHWALLGENACTALSTLPLSAKSCSAAIVGQTAESRTLYIISEKGSIMAIDRLARSNPVFQYGSDDSLLGKSAGALERTFALSTTDGTLVATQNGDSCGGAAVAFSMNMVRTTVTNTKENMNPDRLMVAMRPKTQRIGHELSFAKTSQVPKLLLCDD